MRQGKAPNKTTVLEQLKHGRLVRLGDKGSEVNLGNTNSDSYEPQDMYVGKDKVTFMTELAGREIKVVHYIRATDKTVEIDNFQKIYKKYRPLRTWPMQGALESGENLVAWQRSANLSALIAEAQQSLTGSHRPPRHSPGPNRRRGRNCHHHPGSKRSRPQLACRPYPARQHRRFPLEISKPLTSVTKLISYSPSVSNAS